MKKLLSAVALAACAVFGANAATTIAWPSWAIGTWAGKLANYVPDEGKTYEGLYKLTLSATGVQEEYVFDDDEVVKNDDAWNDVKSTNQADCHLVLSFWYWSDSHTQKFDANMVLRTEGCSHYATSSYSSKITGGDTVDVKELTKLEMNTAPADGWPEWVVGTWRGDVLNYVPSDAATYKGTYTLTVNAAGTNEKYVFEDGDVINHNDDLRGWGITDKADCHVVGTCWCWNDEKDDWFDAKFVFRNTACSHYAKSSGSSIMHAGDFAGKDTCEVADLKKDGGDPAPSVPTVIATAANVNATYDGAAHGISVSVKSPSSGVTVEYALSQDGPWQSEAFTFTDASAATKVWYRALADGYLGVTNSATVTVSPRPISNATLTLLGIPDGGYKYDGAAKTPEVSLTDTLTGFSSSDYDAPVYSDNVNAGTAKVVVTGVGNYAGSVETTFTISPRSLTFTSASAEWAWDGEAHSCETTPTVSGDGFVGTDGATFSGFKSVTAPGSYENTFSYAFTAGTVAANYTVTTTFGTLIVYSYKAETKEDGTLSITGVSDDTAKDSDLYISEEIDGKKVTEVGVGAFANKTTQCAAENVTLSKYVTKVDASAFRGNENLKTITFAETVYTPEDVETKLEIGANAFSSSGVEEIVVPESVSHIGKYAFANCKNLKRVTIKSGTTVDADAFFCAGITQGKKPEVMTIGEFAVNPRTGSATMLVSGTGGAISTSSLRVLYGSTPETMTEEVPFTVGDTELTSEGCSVTVTAEAPEGATGAAFFKAVVE